ncbi:unnamed protein product [Parajaminaea phylloscopi]
MRVAAAAIAFAALLTTSVAAVPSPAAQIDIAPVERDLAPPAAAATPLVKRQGLGGGAGNGNDALTTATGLQTISGYTPPQSVAPNAPVVSSGTIIATGDIPGFNSSAAAASSPADSIRQPCQIAVAALGGVAAGAALILF